MLNRACHWINIIDIAIFPQQFFMNLSRKWVLSTHLVNDFHEQTKLANWTCRTSFVFFLCCRCPGKCQLRLNSDWFYWYFRVSRYFYVNQLIFNGCHSFLSRPPPSFSHIHYLSSYPSYSRVLTALNTFQEISNFLSRLKVAKNRFVYVWFLAVNLIIDSRINTFLKRLERMNLAQAIKIWSEIKRNNINRVSQFVALIDSWFWSLAMSKTNKFFIATI